MPLSQTDVYGTCTSRYERRGSVLLKTRDLKRCQESRLANFWPHSVAQIEDTVSLLLFFFFVKCMEMFEPQRELGAVVYFLQLQPYTGHMLLAILFLFFFFLSLDLCKVEVEKGNNTSYHQNSPPLNKDFFLSRYYKKHTSSLVVV